MASKTEKPTIEPVETPETPLAPETGAFFMHIDDYLNALERDGHGIESISAFAYLQKRLGVVKQTAQKWKFDFEKFLKSEPK